MRCVTWAAARAAVMQCAAGSGGGWARGAGAGCREQDVKRVYYMSMEFLMGRSLLNALFNLDVTGAYGEALAEMGYSLEALVEQERDAVSSDPPLVTLGAPCSRDERTASMCHAVAFVEAPLGPADASSVTPGRSRKACISHAGCGGCAGGGWGPPLLAGAG